jgi:hypothetical protein
MYAKNISLCQGCIIMQNLLRALIKTDILVLSYDTVICCVLVYDSLRHEPLSLGLGVLG